MRANPHILEVNTHEWLNKIRKDIGAEISLADVPESYLFDLKSGGFDAVWLMGVWTESPASRKIARNDEGINSYLAKVEPGYSKNNIIGSQYSIFDYKVNPSLGGDEALLKFKRRLNDFGIALILDFAGNHLSIDNPLTLSDPDIFVRSKNNCQNAREFFKTSKGDCLAYGRDPHYPPWTDTVQINHFNLKARQFLLDTLMHIASMCNGLRCDMVMLTINKVFRETWGKYIQEETPEDEFWPEAIKKIKEQYPFFIFAAEVYWGLEWEVQEMGFDYTYDKTLYDRLLLSTPQDIQGHLNAEHLYQKRSIRFISNHDEEAPVTAFGREKSMAAATVAATITGARLFTLSQIFGDKFRLPIQYVAPNKIKDEGIFNFYKKLLAITNKPTFHGGQWTLKRVTPVNDKDRTYQNILAWCWTQLSTCTAVVINYGPVKARFIMSFDKLPKTDTVFVNEELGENTISISTAEAKKNGLALEMKPYEVKVLSVNF